ncbi:hypothetical protein [uncultured Kordia sp.]|uniref:hypothetical protein n=1 Tax=uncultured Kordia sp. TaxID=507699 RepID=UPI00261B7749|nr:hypothetical protein [uncultured Kordia sp.]
MKRNVVSKLDAINIHGGGSMACSAGESCTGQQTCGNCTVGGSGTLAECEKNTVWGMCPRQ